MTTPLSQLIEAGRALARRKGKEARKQARRRRVKKSPGKP